MLINDILLFIKELKSLGKLIRCDDILCESLIKKCSDRPPEEELSSEYIQWLVDCYKERWLKIVDTESDYTFNPEILNQKWIEFAKKLAVVAKKGYLQILMPDINNTVDYNNLSLLSETVRLTNFYRGHNSQNITILCRKRGLCDHLIGNGFFLSTCRHLDTRKLSAISVAELTRLQASSKGNSEFSINEEVFDNFWDFLQKKVFPRLQATKGFLPIGLLPPLLELIDQYYKLKQENKDFKSFKMAYQLFLNFLYKNKLENINYFYGIKIPYQGKKLYLLDFLIKINTAETYVLEQYLEALCEWLFSFDPNLKATAKELKPLYADMEKRAQNLSTEVVRSLSVSERHYKHCLELLLSLLTTEFEMLFWTGSTITLWDKSNVVFSEAAEIFALFAPLLAENRTSELIPMYKRVMETHIISGQDNVSFYTSLTRFKSVGDWYKHVECNSLSEIGVCWYKPELLMHALLRFNTNDTRISKKINWFLDELIHTYTQDISELKKQFRVNILFSVLIKEIPVDESRYLKILIKLSERSDVEVDFINNCVHHIVNRLANVSIIKEGGAVHFFAGVRSLDIAKLAAVDNLDNLIEVVDSFKMRLFSPALGLDKRFLEKATKYIHSLMRPIVSVQEEQEQFGRSRTLDYLGAST